MKLHEFEEDFQDLVSITATYKGIPEEAVKRDYYIVSMLKKLEMSEFSELCVFKGGTSLSKCYPGSIERFSEDIDLTFLPSDELKLLIQKTKATDSYYLEKRNISKEYNPLGLYDFNSWRKYFDKSIQKRYETLHEDLLYTDQKQNFDSALQAFEKINDIFAAIEE